VAADEQTYPATATVTIAGFDIFQNFGGSSISGLLQLSND
jgi:hypothetical protein